MHRSRSARSDQSDADVDVLAAEKEQELNRCLRQLRIMENDRRAYSIESQDLIKRQMNEIGNLEMEKEEVMKDLRLIDSRSNLIRDGHTIEGLSGLGSTKMEIQDQIKQEKEKQEEIDAEVRQMRRKIREHQKNKGGVSTHRTRSAQTRKKAAKLENTLQLANKKFCSTLEKNKELRNEIENLRQGRARFDEIYKKLEKELQQIKQESGNVVEQSTQAYEARDEAHTKMIQLREKAEKDVQQHNIEMKEYVRTIDHDNRLRDFMSTKCRERHEDPQLVEWRRRKEEIEAQRKQASQTDSVESYEAAFEMITKMTGIDDMELLVQRFIEYEDANFALFNYVNEQNNELELLSEEIQGIRDDIEALKEREIELEAQRQSALSDLEEQQQKTSKEADEINEKFMSVSTTLDKLKSNVESLFEKIGCDRSEIDELLGTKEGVTEKNILQYLATIEARTNQLLYMQAYLLSQKEDDVEELKLTFLGAGPQPVPHLPSVLPPSIGDDNDSDGGETLEEEISRPLTRSELESRVLRSVVKREETFAKKASVEASDAKDKPKAKEKGAGKF